MWVNGHMNSVPLSKGQIDLFMYCEIYLYTVMLLTPFAPWVIWRGRGSVHVYIIFVLLGSEIKKKAAVTAWLNGTSRTLVQDFRADKARWEDGTRIQYSVANTALSPSLCLQRSVCDRSEGSLLSKAPLLTGGEHANASLFNEVSQKLRSRSKEREVKVPGRCLMFK